MKLRLKDAICSVGNKKAVSIARRVAKAELIDWKQGIKNVFAVIVKNHDRIPGNIGSRNDTEEDAIRKWVVRYNRGYEHRASLRMSNPPGTISDPAVEKIIGARLSQLVSDDLNRITFAHRLGMSAENILGLILEEYLFENLKDYGWHCAWGETVKSVDFVHRNGRLLQVKNRSNSENSSSSSVRKGTEIMKWYRIEASRIVYRWDELNKICKTKHLSEESFLEFLKKIIAENPGCLSVEIENPWNE